MEKRLIPTGMLLLIMLLSSSCNADSGFSKSDTPSQEGTHTNALPSTPPPDTVPPRPSKKAIKNCPASLPNGSAPQINTNNEFNHGNPEGTFFTILPDDGRWVFWPGGPGEIREDGSLRIKWPWWRTVRGDFKITGQRLDAEAPPMPEVILHGEEDGYGETGFHPSIIVFPSEGCWEVTASLNGEKLTFVLLVILKGS